MEFLNDIYGPIEEESNEDLSEASFSSIQADSYEQTAITLRVSGINPSFWSFTSPIRPFSGHRMPMRVIFRSLSFLTVRETVPP